MPAIYPRQQRPAERVKKENPQDVMELLNKLKHSGLLTSEKKRREEAEKAERERQAAESNRRMRAPSPPPIACDNRILNNLERRSTPMSALDQFSMRSLIIRYDSIIDSLHKPRITCQYCGIPFNEIYGEAYQRHADWHLQDTLRFKDHKYTRSSPWFMTEEWFNYSEIELVNKAQSIDSDRISTDNASQSNARVISSSSNEDVPSSATDLRECYLCKEMFEEYHDDEDDEWKLRNSVLKDEKAFHRLCLEDSVNITITSLPADDEGLPDESIIPIKTRNDDSELSINNDKYTNKNCSTVG